MEYNATVLSLGYLLSEDKQKILLLYHNAHPEDLSYGKYNGYADVVAPNESSLDCFRRTVFEATQTVPFDIVFRGSIHWANFRQDNRSFFAQIFLAQINPKKVCTANSKGENRWLNVRDVLNKEVPLWQGDKHILPVVFDNVATPFHGLMPYEQGLPQDWTYARA